ncbi:MAG: hypothetical protein WAT89_08750, partial [Candidatus Kapaibacterium sp.]
LDILRQVVKIDPQNRFALRLFIICARKQNNDTATTIKVLAMASLLIVVGIVVGQILIVDSFFDETIAFFNFLRNILIIFALSCFLLLELYFQMYTFKQTGRFPFYILNLLFRIKNKN